MKTPTSSISIIVKGMVVVIVIVQESVLLLCNTKVRSITISFPTRKGAVEFRILPVNRKDGFAVKLLAED
jgi:hypothetical protein